MKTLLLVRHAKSSWDDFSIKDFDRPLNDRGKRDAPVMAKRLLEKGVELDAFIASPAKRAKRTAELFAKEYNRKKEEIIFHEELYLATPASFREVIARTEDAFNSIALFSHNNGITEFANTLAEVRVDDMPTCAVFAVKFDIKSWKDALKGGEFWFFDYPKSGE